ncbi:SDR family NAD(P)-dependent oxidoreductase [Methanosarcina sp. T3]|uniref:SDR family NAD(P)-dependent oxidoreductase n=1 Tax=Methanosarcina sp. T3 TaxID=3439062 RepID=UPI003F857CE0
MSLAGQVVVLVTGRNKGIERDTCFALAKEGADIVIAARQESESRETLDKLKSMGIKCCPLHKRKQQ